MNKHVFKTIVFITILSFLSSCATMPGFRKPQNSNERDIFIQAIAAGAVIGGAAGFLIKKFDKNETLMKYYNKFCKMIGVKIPVELFGSAIGAAIGWAVALNQIENLRDIQLENQQLEALLNSAKQYNRKVADYNNNLEQQIIQLEKKNKEEQKRIAMEKKKQVEEYRAKVSAAITEREKLSKALVHSQKEQYQKTLRKLKAEEEKLDAAINKLASWGPGTV